jgi:hypothetical protein
MKRVDCGIVAGPNSTFLIEKVIQIAEKLSNNKITWYICEDVGYPKKKYPNNTNDFSALKNNKNIIFTKPNSESRVVSGGDRHGMGCDILLKHLKHKEKFIILEPDSIPVCFGWDDIILSKLDEKHPIVTFPFDSNIDVNFKFMNKIWGNIHTPLSGQIGFIGINPTVFTDLNITFTKMCILSKSNSINRNFERLGSARVLNINNAELSDIFELPLNANMAKEWGWRIAYPLKQKGYTSFKFKLSHFHNGNKQHPIDLLYDDNNNLLAIHFHYSRNFSSSLIKSYNASLDIIFNHYKTNELIKELFKNIF